MTNSEFTRRVRQLQALQQGGYDQEKNTEFLSLFNEVRQTYNGFTETDQLIYKNEFQNLMSTKREWSWANKAAEQVRFADALKSTDQMINNEQTGRTTFVFA